VTGLAKHNYSRISDGSSELVDFPGSPLLVIARGDRDRVLLNPALEWVAGRTTAKSSGRRERGAEAGAAYS